MDRKALPFDPGPSGEFGQRLEGGDELGPAVGIARIIECIDPHEQVARAACLGKAEREAEEDGVARRHIGDRNTIADAVLGNRNVGGQRRPAERAQVERQHDMAVGAARRNLPSRVQLNPVPLAIIDAERHHAKSPLPRQRRADHRVEPSRKEDDGG